MVLIVIMLNHQLLTINDGHLIASINQLVYTTGKCQETTRNNGKLPTFRHVFAYVPAAKFFNNNDVELMAIE